MFGFTSTLKQCEKKKTQPYEYIGKLTITPRGSKKETITNELNTNVHKDILKYILEYLEYSKPGQTVEIYGKKYKYKAVAFDYNGSCKIYRKVK